MVILICGGFFFFFDGIVYIGGLCSDFRETEEPHQQGDSNSNVTFQHNLVNPML